MSPFLSWRPLVGSLRACSSAKMAALMCIAAARIGFLLAALHSVAKRMNPRKARPPAPHQSPLASQPGTYPFALLRGRVARLDGVPRGETSRLAIFPTRGAHASLAIE